MTPNYSIVKNMDKFPKSIFDNESDQYSTEFIKIDLMIIFVDIKENEANRSDQCLEYNILSRDDVFIIARIAEHIYNTSYAHPYS